MADLKILYQIFEKFLFSFINSKQLFSIISEQENAFILDIFFFKIFKTRDSFQQMYKFCSPRKTF